MTFCLDIEEYHLESSSLTRSLVDLYFMQIILQPGMLFTTKIVVVELIWAFFWVMASLQRGLFSLYKSIK